MAFTSREYDALAWPRYVWSLAGDCSGKNAQCIARCRAQAAGTFWSAAAVNGDMHSRQVGGCTASTSLLVVCCVDVRRQTMLLPFGLSPTILLLLAVADKLLLLDVLPVNYSSMYRSWLFFPDVLVLAGSP